MTEQTDRTSSNPFEAHQKKVEMLLEQGPLAQALPEEFKTKTRQEIEQFRSDFAEASMANLISMMGTSALETTYGIKHYGDGDQSSVSGKEARILQIQWGKERYGKKGMVSYHN